MCRSTFEQDSGELFSFYIVCLTITLCLLLNFLLFLLAAFSLCFGLTCVDDSLSIVPGTLFSKILQVL
jgi:hypothetical protein